MSHQELHKPYTQFPPPPDQPHFYNQYRPPDIVDHSIYDVGFAPTTCRTNKNRFPLVVDSTDRSSGTIDNYFYNIDDVTADVIAVELKVADIPSSPYLVNQNNNQFYFQDTNSQVRNGEFYQITIPVGNYLADSDDSISIRALLQEGLNQSTQGSTYEVTVNRHTNKFTITQVSGSGIFNIYFTNPDKHTKKQIESCKESCGGREEPLICQLVPCIVNNTMEVLLGFSKQIFCGKTSYTSDFTYNLKQDKYVVLRIESDGHAWNRVVSRNSALKGAFAVLPFNFTLNNFNLVQNLDCINNDILMMEFKEPMKLGKLKISFTNRNGQPIDFNGINHIFVFEVTSLARFDNHC